MKINGRLNFFIKLAIAVFICFCIVTIVKLQFEYNQLREEEKNLKAQIVKVEDNIERLENELAAPFDDEYVVRIAREKLNYCLPEEIIFYSDR